MRRTPDRICSIEANLYKAMPLLVSDRINYSGTMQYVRLHRARVAHNQRCAVSLIMGSFLQLSFIISVIRKQIIENHTNMTAGTFCHRIDDKKISSF